VWPAIQAINCAWIDDPPYFLPRYGSGTSSAGSESGAKHYPTHLNPGDLHAPTNGSSADDYRSVIDDLTIENKKLKARLRKYEKAQNTHLAKDRLFEVKIHSLPARKRRELEDVLREFASSIDGSTEGASRMRTRGTLPFSSLTPAISSLPKHSSSSSTSNSRPIDSAYASMSNSYPTSTSTLNHTLEGRLVSQQRIGKEQNIKSFLHNIPEGLLPKHSPVMTERQKKKLVVQRLEQLFTGNRGANIGNRSQPLQQQEVSKSAAKADQPADHDPMALEGVREAHIVPYKMDANGRPAKMSDDSSYETQVLGSGSSEESSPSRSPEQRPTRPLDLDPNRAQNPSENVEYIRHLGLSTPQLALDESTDAPDAEGWVYLNLLINMAQLHIMNVTPDFVRKAVSDVSAKFQLSQDGKKLRWRGGSRGTQMSSDSCASSDRNSSPHDSDIPGEHQRKRRKVGTGKFTSVPCSMNEVLGDVSGPSDSFHYKPLFHRARSSSDGHISSDESESLFGYKAPNASGIGRSSRPSKLKSERSRSGSKGRIRNDEGPIVFYSGTNFCTDLSGDRGDIMTPLHVSSVGKDGYSNYTQTALGCQSKCKAPQIFRTISGSMLSFRPFRDYSRGPAFFQTEETRPKTPELLEDDSGNDIDFVEGSATSSCPPAPLQNFEASGLGGTRPADHFAVRVQTRRTRAARHLPNKRPKFSVPSARFGKLGHNISKKSLDLYHDSELEEVISDRLSALLSFSPTPHSTDAPLVKTDLISARFARLAPSGLPAPAGYFGMTSSSGTDSDSNTSCAGISHLRRDRTFLPKSFASYSDMDDIIDDNSSDEIDEDDGSVDMLAQAREIDPSGVATREQEFDMELDEARGPSNVPVRRSAATVNHETGTSSCSSDDDGDDDNDD